MTSKREYRKAANENNDIYWKQDAALRALTTDTYKLEAKLEAATADLESATAHADLHAANEQALIDFLGDLLVLEPRLTRFVLDYDVDPDAPIWDLDGAAIAADHVVARELAVQYADVSEGVAL